LVRSSYHAAEQVGGLLSASSSELFPVL
jgi:hypothetical protein